MEYEISFLKSLAFSIGTETLVLAGLIYGWKIFKEKPKLWIVILAGFTATMATIPYLWFIYPLFLHTKLSYNIVSEISAIVVETFIYKGFFRIKLIKALLLSVLCNLASYLLGLLIF